MFRFKSKDDMSAMDWKDASDDFLTKMAGFLPHAARKIKLEKETKCL